MCNIQRKQLLVNYWKHGDSLQLSFGWMTNWERERAQKLSFGRIGDAAARD